MAQIPLKPAALNQLQITAEGKDLYFKLPAVLDFSGAAVDLSVWNDLAFTIRMPQSVRPFYDAAVIALTKGANPTQVIGVADGTTTIKLLETDVNNIPATGSYMIDLTGRVLVGDEYQLIGVGTLNVTKL